MARKGQHYLISIPTNPSIYASRMLIKSELDNLNQQFLDSDKIESRRSISGKPLVQSANQKDPIHFPPGCHAWILHQPKHEKSINQAKT